jgi:hypothetical protein
MDVMRGGSRGDVRFKNGARALPYDTASAWWLLRQHLYSRVPVCCFFLKKKHRSGMFLLKNKFLYLFGFILSKIIKFVPEKV